MYYHTNGIFYILNICLRIKNLNSFVTSSSFILNCLNYKIKLNVLNKPSCLFKVNLVTSEIRHVSNCIVKEMSCEHFSLVSNALKDKPGVSSECHDGNFPVKRVLPVNLLSNVTATIRSLSSSNNTCNFSCDFNISSTTPFINESLCCSSSELLCSDSLDKCWCIECKQILFPQNKPVDKKNENTENDFIGDSKNNFADVFDISPLFSAKFEKSYRRFQHKQFRNRNYETNKKNNGSQQSANKTLSKSPNYFVSIKISKEEIHGRVKEVQEKLLAMYPELKKTMIPLATLHLTLIVMRLESEDDLQRAKTALENSGAQIQELYKKLIALQLLGVDSFRGTVLYAKLVNHEEMNLLAEIVSEKFKEQEIFSMDNKKSFKPHVTILKFSKLPKRGKAINSNKIGIQKLTKQMYSEFENVEFGSDHVTSIQLCSMAKPKGETGYYFVEHEVFLTSSHGDTLDVPIKEANPDKTL